MSRSFRKPSVTPLTALATRLRARPWNLPSSGSSRSVFACSCSPFSSKPMPGGSFCSSLPFGPCTSTAPCWTLTFTPLGIAITFLPILDITCCRFPLPAESCQLPHVAEHFAADTGLYGRLAGHHAARRRENARAQTRKHVRHVVAAEIDAAARTADPLEARDDALAARSVLEEHLERPLRLA